MNAEDVVNAGHLLEYIVEHVPVFEDVQLLGEGIAYHYTPHSAEIAESNHFFGAPVNEELDRTQTGFDSPPASSDPGVVFAYATQKPVVEEGHFGNCHLFKIRYGAAVRGMHSQERDMMAALGEQHSPTLLIMTGDILGFEDLRSMANFLQLLD
jgi:hypothetical protein